MHFQIRKLHSTLEKQLHQVPAGGPVKIFLSTNIAETSLTVPDLRAVIDHGLCRESLPPQ